MDFLLKQPDGSPYWKMVMLQSVQVPKDGRQATLLSVMPKSIVHTVQRKDRPARTAPGPTIRVIHPPRRPAKARLFTELQRPPRTNPARALELPGLGPASGLLLAPTIALLLLAVPTLRAPVRRLGGRVAPRRALRARLPMAVGGGG
jgi:hypothetical protein